MKPETLVLFIESGWSIARVLQLGTQQVNDIPNAPRASGPTPKQAPAYERFNQATAILRELQIQGKVELGYSEEATILSDPIPPPLVQATDLILAAKSGYRFKRIKTGEFQLEGKVQVLKIRRKGEVNESFIALEKLLGVDLLTQKNAKLKLEPRSVQGIMYYLSHMVDVPLIHYESGKVQPTVNVHGEAFNWKEVAGNLFQVRVQKLKPKCAYAAVKYDGFWYYARVSQVHRFKVNICLQALATSRPVSTSRKQACWLLSLA